MMLKSGFSLNQNKPTGCKRLYAPLTAIKKKKNKKNPKPLLAQSPYCGTGTDFQFATWVCRVSSQPESELRELLGRWSKTLSQTDPSCLRPRLHLLPPVAEDMLPLLSFAETQGTDLAYVHHQWRARHTITHRTQCWPAGPGLRPTSPAKGWEGSRELHDEGRKRRRKATLPGALM
jgi:hypothetical protein